MSRDSEEVQSQLIEIKNNFDSLINEILKDAPDKEWVKLKYTELKEKLREESKTFDTVKGQDSASQAETAFYYPAVKKAYLELKVKVNTLPSNRMLQCLISAEDYIAYYISQ